MKIMLTNFARMVKDSGGLAKVTIEFANEMIQRGHQVSLLYCDEKQGDFFYPLKDEVHLHNLCCQYGVYIKMPLCMKLKRELLRPVSLVASRDVNDQFMKRYLLDEVDRCLKIEKPDVIVSSQPAASRLLLCDIMTEIPVITMSHGDPEDYFHTYPKGEIPAVGRSAVCQVLLPSFVRPIKERFPNQKVVVIGNVVPQYKKKADLLADKNKYKIIFVGRLVKNHKRPHLLIEAFAQVANEFPDWEVEIWGAGSNKVYMRSLERLIKKRGLQERVRLMGVTRDVSAVLEKGDIFVLPSAAEGFGLSLAEAMSMGLPAVGYRNCPAVNELIIDGKNGILCEDGIQDLSRGIKQLMEDKNMRVQYGGCARKMVTQYSADKIWSAWELLLNQTVKSKKINMTSD